MSQSIQSYNVAANQQSRPIPYWMHLMTLPISSHITIGLAKIFNFEVLTHGTSLKNYMGIITQGADPSKGGSAEGSTPFYTGGAMNSDFAQRTRNHFYVFKDSEIKQAKYEKSSGSRLNERFEMVSYVEYLDERGNRHLQQEYRSLTLFEKIEILIAPRLHAALSAIGKIPDTENKTADLAKRWFYGSLNGLFSPTLRFIYTLEHTKRLFEDDPDYSGKAYRTPHALSNDKIGLIGVCQQASAQGFIEGMSTRPLRVLSGAVHLVAGTVFTATGLGFFI